jgi:hypothetical protein
LRGFGRFLEGRAPWTVAAAGFCPEDDGCRTVAGGGHVKERRKHFGVPFDSREVELLASMLAESWSGDVEELGDLMLRDAETGREFDLVAVILARRIEWAAVGLGCAWRRGFEKIRFHEYRGPLPGNFC